MALVTNLKSTNGRTMHSLYTFLCLLIIVLISGCTSNKVPRGTAAPIFTTRISDSGLKHFQLSLARKQRRPLTVEGDIRSRKKSNGNQQRKKSNKAYRILEKQAELTLETNSFCRSGFWIIDRSKREKTDYIRGECNEQATADDRIKFPDTLLEW